MKQIARSPKQITVFYDPESCRCLKVLAILRTHGLSVQEIDIVREPPTVEQLFEIAEMLGMPLSELVNREHPVYKRRFGDYDLSEEDWAKMIHKNPEILKNPIIIHGDKATLAASQSDAMNV